MMSDVLGRMRVHATHKSSKTLAHRLTIKVSGPWRSHLRLPITGFPERFQGHRFTHMMRYGTLGHLTVSQQLTSEYKWPGEARCLPGQHGRVVTPLDVAFEFYNRRTTHGQLLSMRYVSGFTNVSIAYASPAGYVAGSGMRTIKPFPFGHLMFSPATNSWSRDQIRHRLTWVPFMAGVDVGWKLPSCHEMEALCPGLPR